MLTKGMFSQPLFDFMKEQNKDVQEDPEKAMKAFCDKMEELMFSAIQNATITLPTGTVNVVNPTAGPSVNVAPIILQKVLS